MVTRNALIHAILQMSVSTSAHKSLLISSLFTVSFLLFVSLHLLTHSQLPLCTVRCACTFLHQSLLGSRPGNSQWLTQPRCLGHPPYFSSVFLFLSLSISQLPVFLAAPLPVLVIVWGNLAELNRVFPNEGTGFVLTWTAQQNSGIKSGNSIAALDGVFFNYD